MAPLFARLSAEQARTYALVLSSAGIRHSLEPHEHHWSLHVPADERRRAVGAIRAYRRENPVLEAPPGPAAPAMRTFSAGYAALLLISIQVAVDSGPDRAALVAAYGADAQRIGGGELYRCVTALLLHSNWAHLSANVAALLLFGTYAASIFGWGVGWLLMLFSGALGNFLTAAWHGHGHRSIGASTAVFAAVGLCAIHAYWQRKSQPPGGWRSWVPLAGGLALVGWLGTAPQSDLLAHLLGFVGGLLSGGLYMWMGGRVYPWPVQWAALGIVAMSIAGGWYRGLAYSG